MQTFILTAGSSAIIKQSGKPTIGGGLIKGVRSTHDTSPPYSDEVVVETTEGNIILDISDGVYFDEVLFSGTVDELVIKCVTFFRKANSQSGGTVSADNVTETADKKFISQYDYDFLQNLKATYQQ